MLASKCLCSPCLQGVLPESSPHCAACGWTWPPVWGQHGAGCCVQRSLGNSPGPMSHEGWEQVGWRWAGVESRVWHGGTGYGPSPGLPVTQGSLHGAKHSLPQPRSQRLLAPRPIPPPTYSLHLPPTTGALLSEFLAGQGPGEGAWEGHSDPPDGRHMHIHGQHTHILTQEQHHADTYVHTTGMRLCLHKNNHTCSYTWPTCIPGYTGTTSH